MADIWLPGYRRHLFALRGKPYQFTHNPKGLLHSTEGGSIAGALSAYAPYPPHIIYDWRSREKVQHIPLNLAAYAAMDGSDDDYMIQVELVGFAAETRNWPEQALRNIAEDVLLPIEKAFGVPRKAIWHGFKDARDGISPPLASTSSPIRINPTQLRDFSGWLGHQHLPAPDEHWDPGALPIQKIFSYMQEGDFMATLSEQEKANLLGAVDKMYKAMFVTADAPAVPGREPETFHDVVVHTAEETQAKIAEGVPVALKLSAEDRAAIVADVLAGLNEGVQSMFRNSLQNMQVNLPAGTGTFSPKPPTGL